MKETLGGIVTLEVLNIQGKFTKEEVVERLAPKIEKYFGKMNLQVKCNRCN